MRRLLWIGIATLALTACSPPPPTVNAVTEPAATSAATSAAVTPTTAAQPTAAQPAATPFNSPQSPTGRQPDQEQIQLALGNVQSLPALYYSPPSLQAPAVLLLSPSGGDPERWDAFARR